jgi:hypothetical protein
MQQVNLVFHFRLDLQPEARVHWFLLKRRKTTMQVIHLGQKNWLNVGSMARKLVSLAHLTI